MDESNTIEKSTAVAVAATTPIGRYIPPHLRGKTSETAMPEALTREAGSRPSKHFSYGRSRAKLNSLGFYGDLTADCKDLFEGHSTTGINFDKYDKIPVEIKDLAVGVTTSATAATAAATTPQPIETFNIGFCKPLADNIAAAGYVKPTPIQKYSIPIGLAGRDLMAAAQTGSGKTAGFLLPVISSLYTATASKTRQYHQPLALVLAPTRELAIQTFEEARKFCCKTGIRPVVVYGGAEAVPQLKEIEQGIDILIATPGRLVDFMQRGRVDLSAIRHLILDEADRMLDMGFEPQIREIVQKHGMPVDRQTFMFSATFPPSIRRLAADFMKPYVFVTIGTIGEPCKDVRQEFEWVEETDKTAKLIELLKTVYKDVGRVLVFVAKKHTANVLQFELCKIGCVATSIHGDRTQPEREEALAAFKSGEVPVLVATDVASRGLDIAEVALVINYDMPATIDDYVHRIGRTGRAGHLGTSVSFYNSANRSVTTPLRRLLRENEAEVPEFLL